MKYVFNALAIFVFLMFLSRMILWVHADIPLDRKMMLLLAALIFAFLVRKPWTYLLAMLIFMAAMIYPWVYHHLSGTNTFDFTSSLYHYYKSSGGSFAHKILVFPSYFYAAMLLFFLLPPVWKAYGLHKIRIRKARRADLD